MKIVRFCISFIFVCLLTLSFTSCDNDDGYNYGDFVISLATVNPLDNNSNSYYLTMDDGTTLWPAASLVNYKPKSNQRVLVDFTLLSDSLQGYDHFVKINQIQEILTKQIIDLTPENEVEVGNDPIRILEYWIGDHYLNIHFGYNSGGEKVHTINMVENKLTDTNIKNDTIVLEFRHNANEDPEKYGVKSFAAFDLRKYQNGNQTSINFLIKVRDFDNENKEYRITYNYGNNTAEKLFNNKIITNMPENVKFY